MLRGAHHVEGEGEGFGNRRCLALAKDVVEHDETTFAGIYACVPCVWPLTVRPR